MGAVERSREGQGPVVLAGMKGDVSKGRGQDIQLRPSTLVTAIVVATNIFMLFFILISFDFLFMRVCVYPYKSVLKRSLRVYKVFGSYEAEKKGRGEMEWALREIRAGDVLRVIILRLKVYFLKTLRERFDVSPIVYQFC